MRAKNEFKLIGEAYGKVHEEFDKEDDYWTPEVEIDSKVFWRQEDGGLRRGVVDRLDDEHAYVVDDDGGINQVDFRVLKVVTDEEYTFGPEPSEGNEYDPDEQKFRNVKPPSKLLTKDQAAEIDANRAKIKADMVKSKFGGERYD